MAESSPKRVENTVGKGEIARTADTQKPGHVWKWVKHETINSSLFTTQSRLLTTLNYRNFENTVGKGENAGNQHFLLFPQCFLPFSNQISIFHPN